MSARTKRRAIHPPESKGMDWYASCAYAPRRKRCFHRTSRSRLRELAKALCLSSGSFDLRSNAGGIAVSGEIILHCEQVYVHVSQPATGADAGILIRTCRGRKDYTGGRNYFAPLSMLDDPAALAVFVRRLIVAEPEG